MRYVCVWLCLLLCVVLLLSCGGRSDPTAEILLELEQVAGALPVGERYYSGEEDGGEGAMPSDLRDALYGAESEEIFATVEEYAIYLSSAAKPYEIAVLRCYSATDAHRVTQACMERRETLRVALRGTEWETLAKDSLVMFRGRDVLLCVSDRSRSVEERARRLLG